MPDKTSKPNTISGRSAFLALLRDEGVTQLFGNPGTTELPIMHALTEQEDLKFVLALQESVVIAIADGYGRASGNLVSCNVHVAPGLGNAIGAIYTAGISNTAMIVTAGQQEQGHGLTEPLLYAPLVPIATPVVKWAVEVNRIEDLPRIVRRAATVATTPPTGPVFISLPGDILNDHAALEMGTSTRVDSTVRPSVSAITDLAQRLLSAKCPVIIAGHEIATSDAFDESAKLATLLGAPVYQQTIIDRAHFPSAHPAYLGPLSRHQPTVRKILEKHDLAFFIGADVLKMSVYNELDAMPPELRVIQLGLRDPEFGKNYAAECALRADVKETLGALLPVLKVNQNDSQAKEAAARLTSVAANNWTEARKTKAAQAEAKKGNSPIDPQWLAWKFADLVPADGVVVDEGITTANSLPSFVHYHDRNSFFGNSSGGIGWGIAAAVGVQMALPERRVAALIGDGSAQYTIQALWTAAHTKTPVVFVIANNGGYRVLKDRLKLFHGNDNAIGMDFENPAIDFAGLGRAYGLKTERVATGEAFEAAFTAALAGNEPVLIEVMVAKTG